MNEIPIRGVIGTSVHSSTFIRKLEESGDNPTIRIHSKGGHAIEIIAMFNAMIRKGVTTLIDGVAASAAGVLALAGKKVKMMDNSLIHFHRLQLSGISGDSEDLQKVLDLTRKMEASIVDTISKKTGKDVTEVENLFARDEFYTAKEALKMGLIDEIVPSNSKFVDLAGLNVTQHIVAYAEDFNRSTEMSYKDLFSKLNMEFSDGSEGEHEDAIVEVFNALDSENTELKAKIKTLQPKNEEPIQPGLLKMAKTFREDKITNFLREGKVTANAAKEMKQAWLTDESLEDGIRNGDTPFEAICNVLNANDTVIRIGTQTGPQEGVDEDGEGTSDGRGTLAKLRKRNEN